MQELEAAAERAGAAKAPADAGDAHTQAELREMRAEYDELTVCLGQESAKARPRARLSPHMWLMNTLHVRGKQRAQKGGFCLGACTLALGTAGTCVCARHTVLHGRMQVSRCVDGAGGCAGGAVAGAWRGGRR